MASGSERGQECEKIMKEGGLVPVEVTLDLLKDAMHTAVKQGTVVGFLIDGFPRELDQGKAFHKKVCAYFIIIIILYIICLFRWIYSLYAKPMLRKSIDLMCMHLDAVNDDSCAPSPCDHNI